MYPAVAPPGCPFRVSTGYARTLRPSLSAKQGHDGRKSDKTGANQIT
jgi:hypothetical protein